MEQHKYYVSFSGQSTSGREYSGDMTLLTEGPMREEDIKQAKKLFMDANPDKGMTPDRMRIVCFFEVQ